MQFITDVQQKVARFAAENATTLLTAGGVVGTVATGILAARGGVKYAEVLVAKKEELVLEQLEGIEPGEEPIIPITQVDTATKIKIAVIHFAPPVIIGGATIASIIMAHRMSSAKIAALAAAYGLAERNLSEYKEKISEKLTGPKKQQIDDEIAQDRVDRAGGHENIVILEGEVLCFDEPTGRYFRSTMEKINRAVNATNAEILHHDHANASFFYEELDMPATTWTDEVGWNTDQLIELKITTVLKNDKPCLSLDFRTLPKVDYVPKHY